MEVESESFDTATRYDCNDPRNEARPSSVVYTTTFHDLQKLNKEAATLLRKPLENSKFQNGITRSLIKEITKRTKEDFPDQVKFAIVGDMKAGKSSVINSILSIGPIARKGDGGDSCTWVVQRYQRMFPDQNSLYAAKVRFFDRAGVRSTIGDLLARYYRAANQSVKDEEDCDDDDDKDYTRVGVFGDMRDAMTAFMAMFNDEVEFETEEYADAFLRQAKSENDPRVLDKLVEWADALTEHCLDGKTSLLIEESTTDKLLWALQPYTCQISGLEGQGLVAPWPLVSAIYFGLDHPLLNEGIVFVDSPGLSDANSSRAKNAIRSHRECTHLIVVVDIGRAEADEPVRKNLQAGSRTRGTDHMILVLTHGDSIDPMTKVVGTPDEKKQLADLEKELADLRKEKKAKGLEQRSRSRDDDCDDLKEEIDSIVADIRRLATERENIRLKIRNRKVVTNMQKIYKGLTSDPRTLATFAVGNQVYQQHVAGFSDDETPLMSVKQTNIPYLREKLYMMPIQGKYNDTMHLAETQLPNLVNTFELYCAQLHLARKNEIEAIVLAPKELLRGVVHDSFEALKLQVVKIILNPMKEEESDWIKQARKCCRNWAADFGGQLAILKSEGHKKAHKGKNNGKVVNWNEELLELGGDSLEELFSTFHRKVAASSWSKDLIGNLVKLCDNARKEIKRDSQFHTLALEPFFKTFNGESRNFDRIVVSCNKTLRIQMGNILDRAVSQRNDDFIATAMKPIYREAAKIKGGIGAPKRRSNHVESAVAKRNGVWIQVHDAIEAAFVDLFRRAENKMVELSEEVFDTLHHNFCLLCDDSEAKDDKDKVLEKVLRDDLKEKAAEVKVMLEEGGKIAELVAQCKTYQAAQAEAASAP